MTQTNKKNKGNLPPFALDGNKYDLTTYIGRTRNFFEIFNPLLLFTTDKQLNECKKLINDYKNDKLNNIDSNINTKLWDARTRIDAIIHPQTSEKIFLPFRMSCFVPMNLPIASGMLLSSSLPASLFWQWYNQSYNVAVNYANGNKSNRLSNIKIFQAYCSAVGISCGIAYSFNKLLTSSSSRFNPSTYYLLSKTIPFTAVALAGSLNVILMRYNEIKYGIDIMDNNGNIIGKSNIAGKYAVLQTAFSRIVLPAPILLFPPYIMKFAESFHSIKIRTHLHLPLNLSLMIICLYGALPMACGLFPQKTSISINKLEKEFHNLNMDKVWFNRGL